MQRPFIDINGNSYDSLEDIPEGAVFDKLDLSRECFTELPEKLATITVRNLNLEGCRDLTSLKGLPKGLKYLNCCLTGITSLEGLPEGLEWLSCWGTKITSLKGLPKTLKKLYCWKTRIKTLKKLYCWKTRITSLKGLPKGLKELDCSHTNINSFEWIPKGLDEIDFSVTPITSLKGLKEGLKVFRCIGTDVTSLEGCPKSVIKVDCRKCPNIKYIPDYISDKVFRTLLGEGGDLSRTIVAAGKVRWKMKNTKVALGAIKDRLVKR